VLLTVLAVLAIPAAWWRRHITRPDYRFARGEDAVRAKDYPTAQAYADRLEAAGSPDHARLLRAEAFYAKSQPYQALKECNKIQADGDLKLRAAVLSGKCLLDMGDAREANRVFAYVLERQPDNADAHRGLGAIAYDLGRAAEAAAHMGEVARLDPADARPHRLLAHIRRDAGDLPGAERSFREAVRLGFPAAAAAADGVRVELAETLVRQGKFAEAVAALDEIADARAAAADVLAVRVQALRGAGRRPEAVAAADRGLADFPGPEFARLRGQLHAEAGDAKAAIPLLEEATRPSAGRGHYHFQDLYQAHFLLAQAYAADGRKADADRANARADTLRRDLDAATQLSQEAAARPGDAAVRRRLAAVFDRLGDRGLADMWRAAAAACK